LFWWLRHNPVFARRWVPGLSLFIAMAGLFWLIDRTIMV